MNIFDLVHDESRWELASSSTVLDPRRSEIATHLDSHFSGPDSHLMETIEIVSHDSYGTRRKRLRALIDWCSINLAGIERWDVGLQQWNILSAYTEFRIGNDAATGLQSLHNAIADISNHSKIVTQPISTSGLTEEYRLAIDCCKSMRIQLEKPVWSFDEFVLVGMVQDWLTISTNPNSKRRTEPIPILLGNANDKDGIALELVAEQIAGPPGIIVPHWIKLGMACMGANFIFSDDICNGMKRMAPGIAVRWWLRPKTLHAPWHQSITEYASKSGAGYDSKSGAVSATIPAACLAKALDEIAANPTIPSPVFHPSMAVSGEIVEGTPILCGEVGLHRAKVKAAMNSGINTVLFGKLRNSAEQIAIDSDFKSENCRPRWVSTLDEVYRQMLRSSEVIEMAKKKVCADWDRVQLEVDTHDSFFEVTEKARGFDRPNVASSESPIEFQEEVVEMDTAAWKQVSLDDVFNDDGTICVDEHSKPKFDRPNYFLVRQPFWFAELDSTWERDHQWSAAVQEEEPEIDGQESGFRAPVNEDDNVARERGFRPTWHRMTREHLLRCALTTDPSWKTVAMVCGAGLGKTTNFKYLETVINRLWDHRGQYFAHFVELSDLGTFGSIKNYFEEQHKKCDLPGARASIDEIKFAWDRAYVSGNILFLVDSLDQADHGEKSKGLSRLKELIEGPCKVWLSGRSHAFRSAKETLYEMPTSPWRFLRVGQLDEPEARQLIETGAYVRPFSVNGA